MSPSATSFELALPEDCASSLATLDLADEIRRGLALTPGRIVLDGSRVRRLGSVMIGTLAQFQKEAATWGGTLVLKDFTMMARQPFEVARLCGHFVWEDGDPGT
ncbi:MAG: hypothetical protein R3F30_10440 [Planctomycetota bacterium]